MSPIMSKRRAESSLEISRQLGPRARLLKATPRRAPYGRHGLRAGDGRAPPSPGQGASSSTPVPHECRAGPTDTRITISTEPCPGIRSPSGYRLVADCVVACQPAPRAARPTPHAVPAATADCKGRTETDDHYRAASASRRRRRYCRACLPGRAPARAQVPGYPQVATRAAMSRRRTLMRSLAAFAPGSSRATQPSSRRWSCTWARKSPARTDARCRAPGCGHRSRRADPW